MTANTCAVCRRPTPDGTVCVAETEQARQQLAEIVETVEAARAVMYRQASTSDGVHSTPGPRDLLDYGAGARLDAVQTALTGWVRAVREDAKVKSAPREGDLIAACADWLAERVEVIRHLEYADEVLREIADCLTAMRYVTDRRRERIYLGMCGAPVPQPAAGEADLPCCVATTCEPHGAPCCHHGDPVECPADPYVGDVPCEGSVYGAVGASKATCKACGAKHDQAARIADRAELAHGYCYSAAEIAEAYPGVVLAGTIRQWRRRGLLTVHGEADGHRLYAVAEVLELAATTKERQAGQGRRETAEMGA